MIWTQLAVQTTRYSNTVANRNNAGPTSTAADQQSDSPQEGARPTEPVSLEGSMGLAPGGQKADPSLSPAQCPLVSWLHHVRGQQQRKKQVGVRQVTQDVLILVAGIVPWRRIVIIAINIIARVGILKNETLVTKEKWPSVSQLCL